MPLAALRRAVAPALAAAAFLSVAPVAGAQVATSAAYAPSCGPGTPCALLRFSFSNSGGSSVLFNSITLGSLLPATVMFAPAAGGVALYEAVDAIGPFGGTGTVAPGGSQLVIDFLGGNGFSFELGARTSGYVEVALVQPVRFSYAPFTYDVTLDGGGRLAGTTAPEPATIALVGGGLALVGFATRRRRRA